MTHISDIKLIRTDTTLDLSQKAEKGMLCSAPHFSFYFPASPLLTRFYAMWDPTNTKAGQERLFVEGIRACLVIKFENCYLKRCENCCLKSIVEKRVF